MNNCVMTYGQLREMLVSRYSSPPENLSRDELHRRLEQDIFGPFQSLLATVSHLRDLKDRMVSDDSLSDDERTALVSEFQDGLEAILGLYQQALLSVPTETIED